MMSDHLVLDECWNRIGVRGDRSCARLAELFHCRNCAVHAEAARRIMQRRVPAGHMRDDGTSHAAPAVAARGGTLSIMVFRVGPEWLALPTASCLGVAVPAPDHLLPHRSNAVLAGVVNIHGKLTAQISLAALLGMDGQQAATPSGRPVYPRLMRVRLGAHEIAAPVHEVHGIAQCHAADVQPLPATLNKGVAGFLTGVVDIGGLPAGLLDAGLLATHVAAALR